MTLAVHELFIVVMFCLMNQLVELRFPCRDSEVEVHEEKQENRCVELGSLGDEQHASEEVASSDQSPASGGPENQISATIPTKRKTSP